MTVAGTPRFIGLGDFNADIDSFTRETEDRCNMAVQQFLFACARAVVTKEGIYGPGTPRATGFAARSWRIGINEIVTGPVSPKVDGPNIPGPQFEKLLQVKYGDTVALTSNCVYMTSLEFGHSGQAPEGMLRVVLEQAQLIMDDVIRAMNGGEPVV